MNIRGIGAASNTAIEPSVATFVDGVYLPRGGAAVASFLDIAGAEVLRGPQGTLFGRNASAGALSLFTAQPQPEAGARVAQEAASGGHYRTDATINLPVGGGAALRLAGAAQEFGGYWHNRLDGRRYGGKD
jgi:iron complex outermembrane receptor protein